MSGLLDRVLVPDDIKEMSVEELEILAEEIRGAILKRCSLIGGHVGSNLGMVEATLALHYVFLAPKDKIVFDVSHQCYTHKILTGRKEGFLNPQCYQNISGFTNPDESVYDHFMVGHTSTSLSLASGLAKARDILHQDHNVIAVIGDGSLSGGEALEGLSFIGSEIKGNLIIVVNDNGMSMVENHGGLYQNLALLKQTKGCAELNLFKALGYDYLYVDKGNDLRELIDAFQKVKDTDKPVVVHINTLKGKGYEPAVINQEGWHKHSPFEIQTGKSLAQNDFPGYKELTRDYFLSCIEAGMPLVVLTAGTPNAFGFSAEIREKFGHHYVDVGIAEEHATAMASAVAKGGAKAVFCVQSSFIQRAYDQLLHDLALNKSPALVLIYNGGISDADATHLACFDMAMITNIPNITYLSPATADEYFALLKWALNEANGPVVMRVCNQAPVFGHLPFVSNLAGVRSEIIRTGSEVALIADGHCVIKACQVADELRKYDIYPSIIHARRLDEADEEMLALLSEKHQIVVTIEDGILSGGYGAKVAMALGKTAMRVLSYGVRKEFTNRKPIADIYKENHLETRQIAEDIRQLCAQSVLFKVAR